MDVFKLNLTLKSEKMTSLNGIDIGIIGLYLLVMLSLRNFAKGKVTNMDDFILGRNLIHLP